MRSNTLVTIAAGLLILCSVLACEDDPTSPDPSPYQGITETDLDGNILSIDPDDWELSHINWGENLAVDVFELDFTVEAASLHDSSTVRVWNYSDVDVAFSTEPNDAVLRTEPESASIPAWEYLDVLAIYTQADESDFDGELLLQGDPPVETLTLPVSGRIVVDPGGVDDTLPQGLGFGPAYPNPTDDSATMRFIIPEEGPVTIIIQATGDVTVRNLLNDVVAAGVHEIIWDGLDDEGEPVPAGIYRARIMAGDFESHGDIQITR